MTEQPWFVDAGYWITLVNRCDQLHSRARARATGLRRRLVTTDPVLLETVNALSALPLRPAAVDLVMRIRRNPNIEVISLTPALCASAFDLYRSRPDKEWGLTDCISFVVMAERGITEALAADQHFVQAGFRALLRE